MSQKSTSTKNTQANDEIEELFEVEKIVGWKVNDEDFYLKVRWVGYAPQDDTYEPERSVRRFANEVVQEYYSNLTKEEEKELRKQLNAQIAINEKIIEEREKKKKEEEEEASASSSTSTSAPEKKKKKTERSQ